MTLLIAEPVVIALLAIVIGLLAIVIGLLVLGMIRMNRRDPYDPVFGEGRDDADDRP